MKRKFDESREEKLTFFCTTNARREYQYVCAAVSDSDQEIEHSAEISLPFNDWKVDRLSPIPSLMRVIERVMVLERGRNFFLAHGTLPFQSLFAYGAKPAVHVVVGRCNGKTIVGFTTGGRKENRRLCDLFGIDDDDDMFIDYTCKLPVRKNALLPTGHVVLDTDTLRLKDNFGSSQTRIHLFSSKRARIFLCHNGSSASDRAASLMTTLCESPGLHDAVELSRAELKLDLIYSKFVKRFHLDHGDVVVFTPCGIVAYSDVESTVKWRIHCTIDRKMGTFYTENDMNFRISQDAISMHSTTVSVYGEVDDAVSLGAWLCEVAGFADLAFMENFGVIPDLIGLIVDYAADPYVVF